MNHRLNQDRLKSCYPLPTGYEERVQTTLDNLSIKKEHPMKRKASFVLVFALITLLAAGGLALTQYGVLDFLFQNPTTLQVEQLTPLTTQVDKQKTVANVQLDIKSSYYDGVSFAMDWTIKNLKPDSPRFVAITRYEFGGQKLWSDGNDSFDGQWLPGIYAQDGMMQDGEYSLLPLSSLTGEKQQVVMDISVYAPTKPLFYLNSEEGGDQDKLGAQKLEEGYIVMDEDMFFIKSTPEAEGESGYARVIGPIESILSPEDYTREVMSISFEVDISKAREALSTLPVKETYTFENLTTKYQEAVKTPAGIYLEMDIKPIKGQEKAFEELMDAGQWQMSDGKGVKIETMPQHFLGTGHTFEDGAFGRQYSLFLPILSKDLPETLSLTFYDKDNTLLLISPIKTK